MNRNATDESIRARPMQPIPRTRAADQTIFIATINREIGDTGVHAHTRSLSDGLRAANQDVQIVSAFGGSRLWLGVFAIRRVLLDQLCSNWSTRWHRHWHRVALQRNLRHQCSVKLPEAVIAQCPLSAAAALHVRTQLGLTFPIIGVCHFNESEAAEYRDKGELSDERAFQAILAMEADVLRRIDAFVYVSKFARQNVEQERSICPRKSAVILNGIDAARPTEPLSRESLGLSANDVVLANVGTLETRKNQLGLLDMFATLQSGIANLKLLLIGEGPDRSAIEKRIAELELSKNVRLLGFRKDVPAILAACDLYVHYAKVENCPVALIEAARAGLPIATLPAGGAAEVLDAIGAGILLDPTDAFASADKLRLLVENVPVRKQIAAATSKGFAARFTREAMVDAYLSVLRSCGAKV